MLLAAVHLSLAFTARSTPLRLPQRSSHVRLNFLDDLSASLGLAGYPEAVVDSEEYRIKFTTTAGAFTATVDRSRTKRALCTRQNPPSPTASRMSRSDIEISKWGASVTPPASVEAVFATLREVLRLIKMGASKSAVHSEGVDDRQEIHTRGHKKYDEKREGKNLEENVVSRDAHETLSVCTLF